MNFVLRLFLFAAGLVLAASVAVAAVLMLAVWVLRAAWCKLTGRPVMPFILRVDPRGGFDRMYRRAQQASPTPRADETARGRRFADVTDVEPK